MNEGIDDKIDNQLDTNLDATRRILGVAEETERTGVEAASNLQTQGEQLKKVGEKQAQMKGDIKGTQKRLSALEQCCCCFLMFNKAPKKRVAVEETIEEHKAYQSEPVKTTEKPFQKAGNIDRVTDDAREAEMDENMGRVNAILGNLKDVAVGMNKELDEQNQNLDLLNEETCHLEVSVQKAQARAESILRK